MEMIQDPQFIKDSTGQNIFAIVPIDRYNSFIENEKILEMKEMEEDLMDYRKAKNEPSEYEPFELVVKRIERRKKKKDPAKMSRKDFFEMIDKRRKSKSIKMSMEDMQDLLVIMQRENSPTSPFSEALERIKKYREKNNL